MPGTWFTIGRESPRHLSKVGGSEKCRGLGLWTEDGDMTEMIPSERQAQIVAWLQEEQRLTIKQLPPSQKRRSFSAVLAARYWIFRGLRRICGIVIMGDLDR